MKKSIRFKERPKDQPVKDPDIRFTGPKGSTRVFRRTDGWYAACVDHGERSGAGRYETKLLLTNEDAARREARELAGL